MVELRRALSGLRGRQRIDLLLDQPDPRAAVRALPADELYHAVQDAGLADASDLIQLTSPEQFQTFLDLDAWRGDEVDPMRVIPWLRAARGAHSGADRDDDLDAWREKLAALDPELVSLLLRSALRIHDLEEDEDPDLEGERFVRTAEGRYIVEFIPDGADYVEVRRLVDDLYDRDPFLAGRVLSAVRWELESDLSEQALRWREGRLADLGYPTYEEAVSWFARPAVRGDAPAGLPDRPPGFWLASFRRETLLDRAAALLPPEAVPRFEGEALAAANATLVADRVDPSDPDAVRVAVESARTLLELGLESLSGGDVEVAARVLAGTSLKTIFQRGFGQLLELRWRAERIRKHEEAAGPVPALDSPIGEAFAAVQRRRPRYYPGLTRPRDEWGSVAAGSLAERPFGSAEEVRRTAAALTDAERLLELGRTLGLAPAAGPNPPTLATLYLTALANERLGRAFSPVPIGRADLPAVARALEAIDDPRLSDAGPTGVLRLGRACTGAAELAPIRAGAAPPPGTVAAVLVSG
ncbi:MAG: hypothetical protein RJA59_1052 [Pseudomonadota bacterium]